MIEIHAALKLLDGGGKSGKGESKYREIGWKLDERGKDILSVDHSSL